MLIGFAIGLLVSTTPVAPAGRLGRHPDVDQRRRHHRAASRRDRHRYTCLALDPILYFGLFWLFQMSAAMVSPNPMTVRR